MQLFLETNSILDYFRTTFLNAVEKISPEVVPLLVADNNGMSNRLGISLSDIIENYIVNFETPDEITLVKWESTFDKQKPLNMSIRTFTTEWNVAMQRLITANRPHPDHELIRRFQAAIEDDEQMVNAFKLFYERHPNSNNRTWAQMLAVFEEQESNIDTPVYQAKGASRATSSKPPATGTAGGTTAITNLVAGGAPASATPGTHYCFVHGFKFHPSNICKRIKVGLRAYPWHATNLITFTQAQADAAALVTDSKTVVPGIGKGNPK